MIVFIVIGRNEGWKITKCLDSIKNAIKHNNINRYEIIYVDSNSIDDSIDRAIVFEDVRIIKLTGNINAAIARNEGVKKSIGDILFFIDGDMEIEESFYKKVINENGELGYDFVSGEYISHFYKNGKFLGAEPYYKMSKDLFESTTGGIFIIKREFWEELGGMQNKYRRCQDLDFGLRMSLAGHKLLRKTDTIAIHHTTSYYDEKRLWTDLFNLNQLYQKSVLYRDHFFNPAIYKFIKREISLFFFILSLVLTIAFGSFYLMFLYFFTVALKAFYKSKGGVSKNLFTRFLYYTLIDIYVFIGLFLFWPSNKKKYSVIQIN